MNILIIIPAYNEELNLTPLIGELFAIQPNYDFLIINDGSSDGTKELLKRIGVKHINLPVNLGLSAVMQTGFKYSLRNNYDVCIQIDGDGQHIPSEIVKLVNSIKSGNDIAIGSRYIKANHESAYNQSFYRSMGSAYLKALARIAQPKLKLTDITSGMRAYNRRALVVMVGDVNNRPEPDTIIYLSRLGFKIEEVGVKMRERVSGKSYLTPIKSIKYIVNCSISMLYVVLRSLGKERY
jgi:glycosyltransferase involved in cell wall biosynthesis